MLGLVVKFCIILWPIRFLRLWLQQFLIEIEFENPIRLSCDNESTLHIKDNPFFHEETKQFEADCQCTYKILYWKHLDFICNNLDIIDIYAPAWGIMFENVCSFFSIFFKILLVSSFIPLLFSLTLPVLFLSQNL